MTPMPLAAAFAALALLAGCEAGVPPSAQAAPRQAAAAADPVREPYVVSGLVTDARGRPLPGAEVFADHTMFHNANVFDVSGEDGRYRIELDGVEPSSWRVGAYIERRFEGETYRMSLHADDPAPFAGRDGAVRNLQWRLSGSDGKGGGLGADANIYTHGGYVDPVRIEVRFEPLELIDGSRGEAFTRVPDGTLLTDVPIGRHRVSARHLPPGGAAMPLRVRVRDTGRFAPSVEAGFRLRYGTPEMELEVEVPDPV